MAPTNIATMYTSAMPSAMQMISIMGLNLPTEE